MSQNLTPTSSQTKRVYLVSNSVEKNNSKKRRKLATESMPGPLVPVSFGESENLEDSEVISSSSCEPNSPSALPLCSETTPFLTEDFLPVLPEFRLDSMVICRLRNKRGQVSTDTFRVFFSKKPPPNGSCVYDEIQAYDSLGACVYYCGFKPPKDLRTHCVYVGHVIHKFGKPSPETSTDDGIAKGTWYRLLCSHCDLTNIKVDTCCLIEIRYGNNVKFKRHLRQYHAALEAPVSYEHLATKLHSNNFKELMKHLMDLIVFENLPFSFVGSQHFHALCQQLNPGIILPSVEQFITYLDAFVQSYVTSKAFPSLGICNSRSDKNNQVLGGTVSMDAWGSPGIQHVLTVLYQYTDSSFRKRRRILAVKELLQRATGKYVASFVTKALSEHDLLLKFFFSLADSGSNMTCAFNDIMTERWASASIDVLEPDLLDVPECDSAFEPCLPYAAEDFDSYLPKRTIPELPHLSVQFRCCSHLCNLVIGSALKDTRCQEVADQVTYLVLVLKYIRQRSHLQDMLREQIGHGAKKPCAVRWNTYHDVIKIFTTVDSFKALDSVLTYAHTLPASPKQRKDRPRLLATEDFLVAQEIYRILNCVARPTDTLQSDNATAPIILSTLAMAYQALWCFPPSSHISSTSTFRAVVLEYFQRKLIPLFTCDTLIAATALNPMKKNLFSWIHENMDGNPLNAPTTLQVKELLSRLIYSEGFPAEAPGPEETDSLNLSYDMVADAPDEVAKYYGHLVPNNTNFSNFWRYHRKQYPRLAKIARILDGLPASTGKVERIFSILGRIQGPSRCRLSVAHLETMLLYSELVRGEDEIIEDKPLRDSNFDPLHSCNYGRMHKQGSSSYPPLLSLF